ncbi:MAG: pitrilysin family protein [Bacteroidia bacterium]
MTAEPTIFVLDNGIRVVHKQIKHSRIVHTGLMINAGSRDENARNNGIAHFIEHSVFKGTEKRKAYHILNRLESVGGELNAYTTREKTCFYASSLRRYTRRTFELLFDIIFQSIFSEKDIEKEKNVILEEIEMYEDIPEDSIYDQFFEMLFPDQPLGYNILGTRETVSNLNRDDIHSFMHRYYNNNEILISVVGNITASRIETMASKYFGHLPKKEQRNERTQAVPTTPFRKELDKEFTQAHCIIGKPVIGKMDPDRYALVLINNVLGGAGMSSRLNMSIREKYGYTYNISTGYAGFMDIGVFHVQFGTDEKYLNHCQELVLKEFKRLQEEKLGTRQLQKAKNQLLGHVAMMEENHAIMMQSQAKSLLDYGRVLTLDEFFRKIDAISAEEVLRVANESLPEDKMSMLVYKNDETV